MKKEGENEVRNLDAANMNELQCQIIEEPGSSIILLTVCLSLTFLPCSMMANVMIANQEDRVRRSERKDRIS